VNERQLSTLSSMSAAFPSDLNISSSSLLGPNDNDNDNNNDNDNDKDADSKRIKLSSPMHAPLQPDWSGRLNIVCNPSLEAPDDFSIDFVEDYIREIEEEDGTVNVSTKVNITENGISISLFDENNDGAINRDEMARGIARLDIPLTPEMHRRIFEEFDTNKDGVITIQEFIQGVKKKESELIPMFRQLDKDGDGYLTFEELRSSKLLGSVSTEAIKELISFVDSLSTEEPDGRISEREFLSTFTMLPSGDNLESLQTFANETLKRRTSG
jgi:Ca2+-binding EF-hand superfamily protein